MSGNFEEACCYEPCSYKRKFRSIACLIFFIFQVTSLIFGVYVCVCGVPIQFLWIYETGISSTNFFKYPDWHLKCSVISFGAITWDFFDRCWWKKNPVTFILKCSLTTCKCPLRPWARKPSHIEAETKWPPFCRRHFQMHFLQWKTLCSDPNFTEVCSRVSNLQ